VAHDGLCTIHANVQSWPRGARTRTAFHEAGHAVAFIHLLGPGEVDAASIRPGRAHAGVTLLASAIEDRRERELAIIGLLAGDEAELLAGQLEAGYVEPSDDDRLAVATNASLERLAPLTRQRLLEAEADEPGLAICDTTMAVRSAARLAGWGGATEAQAHLNYLRVATSEFVSRHRNAIHAVAQALLRDVTLDGLTLASLVLSSRCACHGWTPPTPQGGRYALHQEARA
jgi:hypothetical protein